MTLEQQQALALASARMRAAEGPPVAVDVAKSSGVGMMDALIGLLGMPGDAAELGARGIDAATNFVSKRLGMGEVPRPGTTPGGGRETLTGVELPGASQIKKGVEGVTGEFYKPQTTAGQYAKTIGEFSTGALLPGGLVRRAANVAVPAGASETAGQMTKGTAAEPWARAGGALAGGVLAARGLTPAPATPERARLAAALEAEGVPLTAGQRTGNRPLQWMEAAAADTPIAAGRAAAMNEQQGRAFTGAVMRRMGASGDEIATPDAVNRAVTNLSQRFEDLSARNTLAPDRQFVTDLMDTARDYVSRVIPSQRAGGRQNVETVMMDVVQEIQQHGGTMPGQLYQATRSRLGQMADGVRQSDPQLADAVRGIRNALDGAMNRSINPADRQAWQEARTQWKNWKAIEKAVSGAGAQVAEGFISPSQLRTAVAGQNRGAYARGQGDMADLARAGEALLKPLPQSGTAPRAAAANTFASLGGMLGGGMAGGAPGAFLGAVAPAVAGRAMLSRPMQAYLGNQAAPMSQAQMRNLLLLSQLPTLPRPSK